MAGNKGEHDRRTPAAAYLRMSSLKQDTSIAQQREQVVAYARKHSFEIVRWYVDEGKSASTDEHKRAEFHRMMADAERGEVDAILCLDYSRFARTDTIDSAPYKQRLRNCGVTLVTVLDGRIDWTTMAGRLVDSLHAEAKNDFAVAIGQKTLRGRIDKCKAGMFIGGTTPYGMKRVYLEDGRVIKEVGRGEKFQKPTTWDAKLEPGDPDEVQVVKWLFREFARREVSFYQLARELTQRKIPAPQSTELWRGEAVQGILRNPVYVGDCYIGYRATGAHYRHDRGRLKRIVGAQRKCYLGKEMTIKRNAFRGIVGRRLWNTVQAKIEDTRRERKETREEGGQALSGILFCGNCGSKLLRATNRGKPMLYRCPNADRRRSLGCGYWSVTDEAILPCLLATVIEVLESDVHLLGSQSIATSKETQPREAMRLKQRLKQLDRQILCGADRLLAVPDGLVKLVAERLENLKAERDRLAAQVKQVRDVAESKLSENDTQRWPDAVREGLVQIRSKYLSQDDVRPIEIRKLLQAIQCRLDLWWSSRPNGKRGWILRRGWLRIGHYETELPVRLNDSTSAELAISDHLCLEQSRLGQRQMERIEILKRHVAQYGWHRYWKSDVPGRFSLERWVSGCRSSHNGGSLPDWLQRELEAIPGWLWNPVKDKHRMHLKLIQEFLAEHDIKSLTVKAELGGYRIGRWAASRRDEYRRGRISSWVREGLDKIPGWTWNPKGGGRREVI